MGVAAESKQKLKNLASEMIGTQEGPEIQKELIDNLKPLPLGCPVTTSTGFCQMKAECFWFIS